MTEEENVTGTLTLEVALMRGTRLLTRKTTIVREPRDIALALATIDVVRTLLVEEVRRQGIAIWQRDLDRIERER